MGQTTFDQTNLNGEAVASVVMCGRCGRPLSAAQSRLAGYGHRCAEHVLFEEIRALRSELEAIREEEDA